MRVTREAVLGVLSKAGLKALDVTLCDRQSGKSAPATITVTFVHEADSLRLYQALRSSPFEIGHSKNVCGRYVVTMFAS